MHTWRSHCAALVAVALGVAGMAMPGARAAGGAGSGAVVDARVLAANTDPAVQNRNVEVMNGGWD